MLARPVERHSYIRHTWPDTPGYTQGSGPMDALTATIDLCRKDTLKTTFVHTTARLMREQLLQPLTVLPGEQSRLIVSLCCEAQQDIQDK